MTKRRAHQEVAAMSAGELDAIEAQLARAVQRARDLGWLDNDTVKGPLEPVHDSPVYREWERLAGPVRNTRSGVEFGCPGAAQTARGVASPGEEELTCQTIPEAATPLTDSSGNGR